MIWISVSVSGQSPIGTWKTIDDYTGKQKSHVRKRYDQIMRFKKDGDDGRADKYRIPKKGRLYKCYIKPKGANELEVREYVGFSLIGRTQTWQRVQ